MAWNESTVYEQRVRFVLEVQQETFSFAESCRRYNISRTAGYTWWNRYVEEGFEGLHDRSHRPHHCPHATPEPVEKHIVELRRRHGWGSRKIRRLTRDAFGWAPTRKTIDRIFERHELLAPKRNGPRKPGHPGKPLTAMDEPNAVWTVDFKGHFKMKNGRYCYPLTVQDAYSRYLLACQGLHTTSFALARPVFVRVFREYGLPAVIRSDNGTPFASIGLARLSRLSAWFIRLGIWPETIEPGKPQQNPRHERMHRTLKREATRPPRGNLSAQQRHFNVFRRTFNHVRAPRVAGRRHSGFALQPLASAVPRDATASRVPSSLRGPEGQHQRRHPLATLAGSTSAPFSATSSLGSSRSVPPCGRSTSVPLPSDGSMKSSS